MHFPQSEGLVVLAGQRVSHHPHQLLPGGLAGGGELLAQVGRQHNVEDVSQELEVGRKKPCQ